MTADFVVATGNVRASTVGGRGFFGNGFYVSDLFAGNVTSGQFSNPRLPTNVDIGGTLNANGAMTTQSTLAMGGTLVAGARISLGNTTLTPTTATERINLGGTYSSGAGVNLKLVLLQDSVNRMYGLGVSSSSLDYVSCVAHTWYSGGITPFEKMRLDANGNVGIGNSAAVHSLAVNGTAYVSGATTSSGNVNAAQLSISGLSYFGSDVTTPGKFVATGRNGTGAASGASIEGVAPSMRWVETDQGADGKEWNIQAISGNLRLAAINDANNGLSTALVVKRSGTSIVAMDFGDGTLNVPFGFLGSGSATFGGNVNAAQLSLSGNATFLGTRIFADFDVASVTGRTYFSGLSGGFTSVGAVPPGTNTVSSFDAWNTADVANGAFASYGIAATSASVEIGKVGTAAYLPLVTKVGGSERMRIHTNGNVGIGTAAPAYQLQLSTDSAAKPTTSTWTIASDRRVKLNIENANTDICYSTMKNLPLRRYSYDPAVFADGAINDRNVVGWIAQEVREVLPKAVSESAQHGFDDFLSLDADQLYKTMYGALQALISRHEALETRVAACEAA